MTIKPLEWDSQHFGYQIGCITLTNDTPEDLLIPMLKNASPSFRLIYLFLPEQKTLSSRICDEWNIALADQKVVFRKELISDRYPTSHSEQIKAVMHQDHPTFIELAIASGEYSRFRLDANFSKNEFESLYQKWIKNSLNGQIADNCFVYFEQQYPIGIITIKKEKYCATIGIIAVDSDFRGKGVGHKLLYASEKYAYENGLREITVATQQGNSGACHFYQQNGYLLKETTNIYHFWNNDYHPLQ